MLCTACNEQTRVAATRHRDDGATRRRRECLSCGRRFWTEETPETADWLGELPLSVHGDGSGPLEAVRRRAILTAARDEIDRRRRELVVEMELIVAEMRTLLGEQKARREVEEVARS